MNLADIHLNKDFEIKLSATTLISKTSTSIMYGLLSGKYVKFVFSDEIIKGSSAFLLFYAIFRYNIKI